MFGNRMSFGTGCILKKESKRNNLRPLRPVGHFLSAVILGGLLVFFIKIKKSRLFSVERNLVCVESFPCSPITQLPLNIKISSRFTFDAYQWCFFVLGIAWKTVDVEDVTQRAPKRCFNLQ